MTTDTQFESWEALQDTLGHKQLKIFFRLADRPSTGAELAKALGITRDWITPRISELRDLGMVEDSNIRRVNPESGKLNIVWQKVPGPCPKPRMKTVTAKGWAIFYEDGSFCSASKDKTSDDSKPCEIRYKIPKPIKRKAKPEELINGEVEPRDF